MKLPLVEKYRPLVISLEGWPSGLRRWSGNQINVSSNPAYFAHFFNFFTFCQTLRTKSQFQRIWDLFPLKVSRCFGLPLHTVRIHGICVKINFPS